MHKMLYQHIIRECKYHIHDKRKIQGPLRYCCNTKWKCSEREVKETERQLELEKRNEEEKEASFAIHVYTKHSVELSQNIV